MTPQKNGEGGIRRRSSLVRKPSKIKEFDHFTQPYQQVCQQKYPSNKRFNKIDGSTIKQDFSKRLIMYLTLTNYHCEGMKIIPFLVLLQDAVHKKWPFVFLFQF